MLLVRTYLAPSSIHGIGLFAAEPIPAGSLVWAFDKTIDRVISDEEYKALLPIGQDFVWRYHFQEEDGTRIMCGDDARFMNHSDHPNLKDDPIGPTTAARDIAIGEELTCNYTNFDSAWMDKFMPGYTTHDCGAVCARGRACPKCGG